MRMASSGAARANPGLCPCPNFAAYATVIALMTQARGYLQLSQRPRHAPNWLWTLRAPNSPEKQQWSFYARGGWAELRYRTAFACELGSWERCVKQQPTAGGVWLSYFVLYISIQHTLTFANIHTHVYISIEYIHIYHIHCMCLLAFGGCWQHGIYGILKRCRATRIRIALLTKFSTDSNQLGMSTKAIIYVDNADVEKKIACHSVCRPQL